MTSSPEGRQEAAVLDAFARELIRDSWEGRDGSDIIQELAVKYGLIKGEPYDPSVHGTNTECEPGETLYTFSGPLALPAPVAAVAQIPIDSIMSDIWAMARCSSPTDRQWWADNLRETISTLIPAKPVVEVVEAQDIANKLRSPWGFSPHSRNTLPVEWQKGLDAAADVIDALQLEADQLRREKNKLVLSAYPAMDAVDAIRAWCKAQKYGNDTITVSKLRDMLPTALQAPATPDAQTEVEK